MRQLGVSEEQFQEEQGVKTDVFPYGVHKDKLISEVPFKYLYWVYEEHDLSGWLKDAVEKEVEKKIGENIDCFTTYYLTSAEDEVRCAGCEIADVCKDIDAKSSCLSDEDPIKFAWDE